MARFTIYQDSAREYRWRLKANNGRTTADSGEGYSTRQAARDAVDRVRRDINNADIDEQ